MGNQKLDDWEIELIGDVQNFCPIVKEVADELDISDYAIEAKQVELETTTDSAWFNIFSVDRRYPSPILIGVLTLKSIGSMRTILRIPPRSQWSKEIKGDELMRMALVGEDEEDRAFYDAQFAKYIERLQAKLKHYGLKFTWYKRLWRWFKEIIGIAKAVKP